MKTRNGLKVYFTENSEGMHVVRIDKPPQAPGIELTFEEVAAIKHKMEHDIMDRVGAKK